jgi:hypothetical protein
MMIIVMSTKYMGIKILILKASILGMIKNKFNMNTCFFDLSAFSLILIFYSQTGLGHKPELGIIELSDSDVIRKIYHDENKSKCYTLEAYRLPSHETGFEDAKNQIEQGSFYNMDDNDETLTVEKKISQGETEISVRFWKHRTETKIILVSCTEHLKTNRSELNKLFESLKNNNRR